MRKKNTEALRQTEVKAFARKKQLARLKREAADKARVDAEAAEEECVRYEKIFEDWK